MGRQIGALTSLLGNLAIMVNAMTPQHTPAGGKEPMEYRFTSPPAVGVKRPRNEPGELLLLGADDEEDDAMEGKPGVRIPPGADPLQKKVF